MQTAMWITLGYAGYCVVIAAGWYGLVSAVRRAGVRRG